MKLIDRNLCVITGKEDLELLYSFKDFPIFMGCVDHSPEHDLRTDMSWWISRSTGSLQLNPLIPLEVLYSASHGSGSTGRLWQHHHMAFAEFLFAYRIKNALEIGAGHGILAKNYIGLDPDVNWTIVEPNPTIEPGKNIQVIRGLFDHSFTPGRHIDAIVHSHVLEHIYEPREFMAAIGHVLSAGKMHLFSVPRLEVMLERKYTNCINFEHTVFLTEPFIDFLLEENGFRVVEKNYFLDDHSIFYAAQKMDGDANRGMFPDQREKNRKLFNDYISFHHDLIADLHRKINMHKGKVYLFGGHVFSQYLIGFGLNENRIESILDNDPVKQGKRLYGTSCMVRSPKILGNEKNAAVILRSGVYNQEIKEDIINNINQDILFWE